MQNAVGKNEKGFLNEKENSPHKSQENFESSGRNRDSMKIQKHSFNQIFSQSFVDRRLFIVRR